ncbi:hypothetical protein [Aquicoccus porphyridii]|uniref:hypothetical protein n=1 Tax=Aquicoccus porphyridii TaxID=1852029 RepID=UPI0011B93BA4|nr:hypothetical protein [Aquicoccus porphyridii]
MPEPPGRFQFARHVMTNQIAIGLGLVILGLLGLDWYLADGTGTLFLVRKGAELIEWMAFWR